VCVCVCVCVFTRDSNETYIISENNKINAKQE